MSGSKLMTEVEEKLNCVVRFNPDNVPSINTLVKISPIKHLTSSIIQKLDSYKFKNLRGVVTIINNPLVHERLKNLMPVYIFETGTVELIPTIFLVKVGK